MPPAGRCSQCNATGKCPQCDGTGQNPHLNAENPACDQCAGRGDCTECASTGVWSPSTKREVLALCILLGAGLGMVVYFHDIRSVVGIALVLVAVSYLRRGFRRIWKP